MKQLSADISLDDYRKILDYFDRVIFCGTVGDPVFHPNFVPMLEMARLKNRKVEVFTAASHRPEKWFKRAFESNPHAKWTFGIDGLPSDSHKHRVNQDGEFLFKMMLKAKDHGIETDWQHIVFKYNQDTISEAKALALEHDLNLNICMSSRWRGPDDPLKPDPEFILARRPGKYEYGDVLDPACFSGHPIGHSSQGYIVPCCWMTNVDVEATFPELCNEKTRISNVERIEDILQYWHDYGEKLKNNTDQCYLICWEKCNSKNTRGRQTYERVDNQAKKDSRLAT